MPYRVYEAEINEYVSILHWRCAAKFTWMIDGKQLVFQFSIGDAEFTLDGAARFTWMVEFQFSIGDAGFLGP